MAQATKVDNLPRTGTIYIPNTATLATLEEVLLVTDATDIKVTGANSKDNIGSAGSSSRPATYHTIEFFAAGERHLVHTNMPFFISYQEKVKE